ncbi:gluconokinase [Marinoscillum sp. MHG1-6]|uniref:gluconokinase n=1 Tax=Marinoscillum sp. MHG1-6 TaxID=2959627 RepID=UPI002157FF12|nr:gluconokinase [Marinoscillum sp. MHG1-6]
MDQEHNSCFIVCGVSGSGKTTIGKLLAQKLGLPFFDADDYHPTPNINKMKAGTPLTDRDRKAWLEDLRIEVIQAQSSSGFVLACSALKEKYREYLSSGFGNIQWVILLGDRPTLLNRLGQRKEHFFNADLLDSQLQLFEKPEYGWKFEVTQTPESIVDDVLDKIKEVDV